MKAFGEAYCPVGPPVNPFGILCQSTFASQILEIGYSLMAIGHLEGIEPVDFHQN